MSTPAHKVVGDAGKPFQFSPRVETTLNEYIARKIDTPISDSMKWPPEKEPKISFNEWYLRAVGVSLDAAKARGVSDLWLLEQCWLTALTKGKL